MRSTYKNEDVEILLKDITGLVEPLPTEEREKLIQSGIHYCRMIPQEYKPSEKYMEAYRSALSSFAGDTAQAVANVSQKIFDKKGTHVALVSLARAGTSIGVLIKRYLKKFYGIDVAHYTISIIRGKGIDENAMNYILKRHLPENLQFVDGWIGKGAISNTLNEAVKHFEGVSSELAVLSDPAGLTSLCGTHRDILIPSSCLNSTVSGLMSRTFLREDIIGKSDFHGAVYYGDMINEDLTYDFIENIEKKFPKHVDEDSVEIEHGSSEIEKIAKDFKIGDINLIKPGIGEATRVLLRRTPWKILIGEKCANDKSLKHIYQLAKEKSVDVVPYHLKNYMACGIIRKHGDV